MSRRPAPALAPALRDTALGLLLVAVVLVGFDDTFASRDYLVGGLVGAVGAALLALVVAVRGRGTDVFLLCAVPGYVLLGVWGALRSFDALRLPGPGAVVDVLTATLTAPGEALTTIPLLDARGPVAVLPYAVGYLGAGAAVWTALRSRRAVAPVVPVLVAQALVTLLAVHRAGTAPLWPTAVLVGGGFAWVLLRGGGSTDVDEGGRGAVLRAAAVLALVGAVTGGAALVAPQVANGDRTTLRGRVGSGAEVDVFDNPLLSFRRFTPQPEEAGQDSVHGKVLLRVDGVPEGTRLRFVTLDEYDGTAWRAGNRTVPGSTDDLFQRISSEVAAPGGGRPVTVSVEVERPWTGGWLPLAGELTGLDFDFLDGRAQREDVRYNPATSSALVVGGLQEGDDYTFTSVLGPTKLTDRMRPWGDGTPLQEAGAALDPALTPWRRSGDPAMEQLFSLARYLRAGGRYSDGDSTGTVPPGHDLDRLLDGFFTAPRTVGDDEQFAAFLALAANRLGVPARVVVGALPRQRAVRGRDVSAWIEVRIRDGSWRPMPTGAFMTHRPPRRTDRPPTPPQEYVAQPDRPEGPSQDRGRPDGTGSAGDGGSAGAAPGGGPGGWPWWVLLGALPWSVPLAKRVRRTLRRRRGRPSRRVVGGWRELLDLARDQGRGVPAGLTRADQARALGAGAALAARADASIFAPAAPGAAEAAAFWVAVDAERRALVRRVGPVRRLVAWWSPWSLLPARRTRPGDRG